MLYIGRILKSTDCIAHSVATRKIRDLALSDIYNLESFKTLLECVCLCSTSFFQLLNLSEKRGDDYFF